jgi:hypothetical protein
METFVVSSELDEESNHARLVVLACIRSPFVRLWTHHERPAVGWGNPPHVFMTVNGGLHPPCCFFLRD